jgi:hypothetical protein
LTVVPWYEQLELGLSEAELVRQRFQQEETDDDTDEGEQQQEMEEDVEENQGDEEEMEEDEEEMEEDEEETEEDEEETEEDEEEMEEDEEEMEEDEEETEEDEEEMEEDVDEEMEEDAEEDQRDEMRNFFPIYISQDRAIDWVRQVLEKRYPSPVDVNRISSTFTSFGERKERLRLSNMLTIERTDEMVLRMRSKLTVPIGYRQYYLSKADDRIYVSRKEGRDSYWIPTTICKSKKNLEQTCGETVCHSIFGLTLSLIIQVLSTRKDWMIHRYTSHLGVNEEMPIFGNDEDGNLADKVLSVEMIDEIIKSWKTEEDDDDDDDEGDEDGWVMDM